MRIVQRLENNFCKKIFYNINLFTKEKKILIFVFGRIDCCHKNNNHHNRYDNIDFRQSQEKKVQVGGKITEQEKLQVQ